MQFSFFFRSQALEDERLTDLVPVSHFWDQSEPRLFAVLGHRLPTLFCVPSASLPCFPAAAFHAKYLASTHGCLCLMS